MTPAEKFSKALERIKQELLEALRISIGGKNDCWKRCKIKRDPEKLKEKLPCVKNKKGSNQKKKREERTKENQRTVRNIRKIETEMEIKLVGKRSTSKYKKENCRKLQKEKNKMQKNEENRKIKYKNQYLGRSEEAHYDRYANESREELMARLEMKDRERAHIENGKG